jgi:hypothetical protein
MQPMGMYLIAREQLGRDAREADEERRAMYRRPDAAPAAAAGESEPGRRAGWLARILIGHRPPAARRKGAHI